MDQWLIRKDNGYAIKIFRLNTITYPDSLNVWDSLSEAYLASDKPEQAKEALYKLVDNFKSDQIWYKRMLGKIGEKKYIDYWNGVNYNKNKLSQYLGKYDSGMDNEFYIEITEKDGKLFVNTSGGLKDLEMKADSDTEFFSQQRPWQVRFADFKDGKAETMYMSFSQSRFNPMKRIH